MANRIIYTESGSVEIDRDIQQSILQSVAGCQDVIDDALANTSRMISTNIELLTTRLVVRHKLKISPDQHKVIEKRVSVFVRENFGLKLSDDDAWHVKHPDESDIQDFIRHDVLKDVFEVEIQEEELEEADIRAYLEE